MVRVSRVPIPLDLSRTQVCRPGRLTSIPESQITIYLKGSANNSMSCEHWMLIVYRLRDIPPTGYFSRLDSGSSLMIFRSCVRIAHFSIHNTWRYVYVTVSILVMGVSASGCINPPWWHIWYKRIQLRYNTWYVTAHNANIILVGCH